MAIREPVAPSEDSHALQDSVHALLSSQLSSAELRSALATSAGYSTELHACLAGELGLAGLTIPEEFGGLGLPSAEACAVHSELGRALYPGPFLPSLVAAGALLAAGDREASERWLPLLADGSAAGTVAAADEAGLWSPGPGSVRAEHATGGWRLYGRRWYVVAAHVASIIVVPAITDAGLAMFAVESDAEGFTVSRQLDLDLTRRISIATFDAAPTRFLGQHADAVAALARAEHEFLIATAAEAAGGIGWCLDASLAHAREREQSGRPAGSFEAVAGACIDMLADLQSVSAAARYAAITAAAGSADAPKAAHTAALQAGECYRRATEATIHLLSDVGSASEQDAQLHYRRAWSAERLVGGPQAHRAAIADHATPEPLNHAPGPGTRSWTRP